MKVVDFPDWRERAAAQALDRAHGVVLAVIGTGGKRVLEGLRDRSGPRGILLDELRGILVGTGNHANHAAFLSRVFRSGKRVAVAKVVVHTLEGSGSRERGFAVSGENDDGGGSGGKLEPTPVLEEVPRCPADFHRPFATCVRTVAHGVALARGPDLHRKRRRARCLHGLTASVDEIDIVRPHRRRARRGVEAPLNRGQRQARVLVAERVKREIVEPLRLRAPILALSFQPRVFGSASIRSSSASARSWTTARSGISKRAMSRQAMRLPVIVRQRPQSEAQRTATRPAFSVSPSASPTGWSCRRASVSSTSFSFSSAIWSFVRRSSASGIDTGSTSMRSSSGIL